MENSKESLAGLMIGYKFKRPALLTQALTHPSYAEEGSGCHNGAKGASGRGRSKCEAKQEAARRSLVLLPPIEEPFFSAE